MAQTVATPEVESAPFSHLDNEGVTAHTDNPSIIAEQAINTQTHEAVVATPVGQDGASMLAPIPMSHGLILAGILFAIGLCGVMVRRNFLFMLMSLEIMMNAAALAFIVAGSRWVNPDGQVMFIFILTLAAAEAAIGLAILLQFYHKRGHLDVDSANEMKG